MSTLIKDVRFASGFLYFISPIASEDFNWRIEKTCNNIYKNTV